MTITAEPDWTDMSAKEPPNDSHCVTDEIANFSRQLTELRVELEGRVLSLEQKLAESRAEVAAIRTQHVGQQDTVIEQDNYTSDNDTSDNEDSPSPAPTPAGSSRRDLLKKGGIGLAVAAVTAGATSKPAAAADGEFIEIGAEDNFANTATILATSTGTTFSARNLFLATTDFGITGASFPAAIAGYGYGDTIHNGVYGFSSSRDDSNSNTGHAVVAATSASSRSNLLIRPRGNDPRTDTYSHQAGEVRADNAEDLWFCVASGTPGTWRKLTGPAASGAVHAITPKRVWDTRFQGGPMVNDEMRTISVADGRVLSSSTVDVPNLVPDGAQAVMFNLAVVNTSAAGFIAVTPGGAGTFTAASINWFSAGAVLNNGTMSTVDASRQVSVWCSGSADFIIDIIGYLL